MLRFGRTNVQVPAISLGTWGHGGPNVVDGGVPVGWSGNDDSLAKAALFEAHRKGITHWDTADAYGSGHAEQLIGEVFAEGVPRKDIGRAVFGASITLPVPASRAVPVDGKVTVVVASATAGIS